MKPRTFLLLMLALALASGAYAQDTPQFSDVPKDHWASKAALRLLETGLIEGDKQDRFRGKEPMTRYEFAIGMARLVDKTVCLLPPPPAVTQSDMQVVLDRLTKMEERLKALEDRIATKNTAASPDVAPEELKKLGAEFAGLNKQLVITAQKNVNTESG